MSSSAAAAASGGPSSSSSNNNALEWLAGGMPFLGKAYRGGGIESIDSCTDVTSLLNGIDEYLNVITSKQQQQQQQQQKEEDEDADVVTEQLEKVHIDDVGRRKEEDDGAKVDEKEEKDSSSGGVTESNNNEFAARLARLRFLLYDERRSATVATTTTTTTTTTTSNGGITTTSTTTSSVAESIVRTITTEDPAPALYYLIPRLLENMYNLPFESRKHVAAIVNYLLVCGIGSNTSEDWMIYHPVMMMFQNYILSNFDLIMIKIVNGFNVALKYNVPDIALHCGTMYRSICKHVALYQQLVLSTERVSAYIFPFLDVYVHTPDFDVSSDAMECIRVVFTGASDSTTSSGAGNNPSSSSNHENPNNNNNPNGGNQFLDEQSQQFMLQITAEFLLRDYDAIWDMRFNPKLLTKNSSSKSTNIASNNYMTRRMALQILSSVLLTRSNYSTMIKYVSSKTNLKLIMCLLRETSPHITLDAFNVFKVFVANPNKPPEIIKILSDNKVKLCKYLATLHNDREATDTQFRDEKKLIIATIQYL